MTPRQITAEFHLLLAEYAVVTLFGPRQAGKTTLACEALPNHAYSNLENPETREFASTDPRAYLNQFTGPVIIDEIQRVPSLLSYIQGIVDEEKSNGRFVLTGSHQPKYYFVEPGLLCHLFGIRDAEQILPMEIKSAATFAQSHLASLRRFQKNGSSNYTRRSYLQWIRPSTERRYRMRSFFRNRFLYPSVKKSAAFDRTSRVIMVKFFMVGDSRKIRCAESIIKVDPE